MTVSAKVDFQKWLDEFNKESLDTSKADAETLEKAAQELKRRVVQRTPVGTPKTSTHPGLLRSSWRLDKGAARDNSGKFSSMSATVGSGGIALAPIPNFVLSNQQPYAQRIEYGWSKQAPEGMLRVSIAEWDQILAMFSKSTGTGLIVQTQSKEIL